MSKIVMLEGEYDWESLCDIGRDVQEALEDQTNPVLVAAHDRLWNGDGNGGTIKVSITWEPDENE